MVCKMVIWGKLLEVIWELCTFYNFMIDLKLFQNRKLKRWRVEWSAFSCLSWLWKLIRQSTGCIWRGDMVSTHRLFSVWSSYTLIPLQSKHCSSSFSKSFWLHLGNTHSTWYLKPVSVPSPWFLVAKYDILALELGVDLSQSSTVANFMTLSKLFIPVLTLSFPV